MNHSGRSSARPKVARADIESKTSHDAIPVLAARIARRRAYHRATHKGLLGRLGPGLITGASDDDPSGIATYSQTGAQFGHCFDMVQRVQNSSQSEPEEHRAALTLRQSPAPRQQAITNI